MQRQSSNSQCQRPIAILRTKTSITNNNKALIWSWSDDDKHRHWHWSFKNSILNGDNKMQLYNLNLATAADRTSSVGYFSRYNIYLWRTHRVRQSRMVTDRQPGSGLLEYAALLIKWLDDRCIAMAAQTDNVDCQINSLRTKNSDPRIGRKRNYDDTNSPTKTGAATDSPRYTTSVDESLGLRQRLPVIEGANQRDALLDPGAYLLAVR